MKEPNIPKKEELIQLSRTVYTDGQLVYKFDYKESPDVFRQVQDDSLGISSFDEVIALKRVEGLQGCQQIVGFIDDVLVTRLIPGYNLDMTSNQQTQGPAYSDEQLESYFKTLIEMGKRGVSYDQKPKNIMFHPDYGFTPIDYMTMPISSTPHIMLFPILFGISGANEHSGGFPDGQGGLSNDPEFLAVNYNRMLTAFHEADPKRAIQIITSGFDPKNIPKLFYKELNPDSKTFNEMQEILKERYQSSLEQLIK
ncbi:MAG: hypothetical protein KKE20_01870 [Nanoarchaeota archaeon]|nr:hypothetical protein [Nanoarchaeota archaeon]